MQQAPPSIARMLTAACLGPCRYEVTSGGGKDVDDVEFYFTPSDYTVQFRAARRTASNDRGANGKLMEKLRISLGFEKVRGEEGVLLAAATIPRGGVTGAHSRLLHLPAAAGHAQPQARLLPDGVALRQLRPCLRRGRARARGGEHAGRQGAERHHTPHPSDLLSCVWWCRRHGRWTETRCSEMQTPGHRSGRAHHHTPPTEK